MNTLWITLTTVQNEAEARILAAKIIDLNLAACAQIDGPIISLYKWEDKRCESKEWRVTFKVIEKNKEALFQAVKRLHSYETPEILAVQCDYANPDYLNWASKYAKLKKDLD